MNVAVNNTWWICMLLAIPIVLMAGWARIEQGSWFAPGAFFSLLWVMYAVGPLMLAPDLEVWPGALVMIWTITLMVYVGTVTGLGQFGQASHQVNMTSRNTWPARDRSNNAAVSLGHATMFCGILGCIAVVALVQSGGYSIGDLLSTDAIAAMAQFFSTARYAEEYRPPAIVQVFLVFMYASALLGGSWFACSTGTYSRVFALFPFVPAMLVTVVQTTRAPLLFQIVFWLSAYWGMKIFQDGPGRPFFTRKSIVFVPFAGCVLLLGFSMVLLVRYGLTLDSLIPVIGPRFIRGDVVGYLVAFGEWLRSGRHLDLAPSFGAITFGGIFEILGIKKRVLGIHEDVTDLDLGEFSTDTNIYTVFRGLIEDFTLPGTLAILFCIGFVGGTGYRMVARRAVAGLPLLISFYWFALWSPIAAVTTYNTLIVAFFMFAIYVVFWVRPPHTPRSQ
ncbi:MAG: oligosaccharide repeat unit polymerase [Nitrospira sp. CR1.1]|nr:oligosaccharide repeat unit polymerase [Nitrospira sp. CR1.1]